MSSLPRGGSYPSIVIPTGAKHRVQSPLERWPCKTSADRPEMESRPYEFLLQFPGTRGYNNSFCTLCGLLFLPCQVLKEEGLH